MAMGRAGRRYAEQTFSPETAADSFEEVFLSISVLRPDSAPNSAPDGRPVTGRQTVRDQGMSWSDRKLIPTTPSSTMGDEKADNADKADNKVTASGPFPHHVG
jgi:hypothetical protein